MSAEPCKISNTEKYRKKDLVLELGLHKSNL